MKTIIISAKKTLEDGNLVIFPTETVYGLGANALSKKAVNKLFKLKKLNKKSVAWRTLVLIILALIGLVVIIVLIGQTKGSLNEGFDYIKGIF